MIRISSTIGCSFDTTGNVYFSPYNDINNLHEVVITNKDELMCEKYIDYNPNNCSENNSDNDPSDDSDNNSDDDTDGDTDDDSNKKIIIGKLVPFADNATLRGSIIKQKKDEQDEMENDPNADYDEDDYEDVLKKTYYEEDAEYNEYVDENEDDEDDKIYTHPSFSFSSDHKKIKQHEINNLVSSREEILALYDTLVYNGDPSDASLIFKTKLLNDAAIYRLCIYTSGDIKFRPIGSREKNYKLSLNENNIILLSQVVKSPININETQEVLENTQEVLENNSLSFNDM